MLDLQKTEVLTRPGKEKIIMGSKIRIENPKHLDERLTKAIEYLKSIGCKEIILFGSLSD